MSFVSFSQFSNVFLDALAVDENYSILPKLDKVADAKTYSPATYNFPGKTSSRRIQTANGDINDVVELPMPSNKLDNTSLYSDAFLLDCFIDGCLARALINTGSSTSIISTQLRQKSDKLEGLQSNVFSAYLQAHRSSG